MLAAARQALRPRMRTLHVALAHGTHSRPLASVRSKDNVLNYWSPRRWALSRQST